MADERHIEALKKILNDRIAERRTMAAGYPEAENRPAMATRIAATQIEIEALERALVHEESFLPRSKATLGIGKH